MDFSKSISLSKTSTKPKSEAVELSNASLNLQFYIFPPTEQIDLLEFESLAISRLKMLKMVESAGQRFPKGSNDYIKALSEDLHNSDFASVIKSSVLGRNASDKGMQMQIKLEEAEQRKDVISHFILRLAFCRSPDLRSWFIAQEVDLFRLRFELEGPTALKLFLERNRLNFDLVSEDEKKEISQMLVDSTPYMKTSSVHTSDVYKVPFTEALDLVKNRKIYLHQGFAYVLKSDLVSIVATKFRAHLSYTLAVASRHIEAIQEEERLKPILKRLGNSTYLGPDYNNRKTVDANVVTADTIESLVNMSFPLCMRQLHASLKQHHHLKHGGRMQYGLFLKGIGLSLEEALKFFRTEFTKAIDQEKFDKMYAYNIRHNYGKEGKRADYTPYSCVKIITNPVGPQDPHGCPFKQTDPIMLKQKLEAMKLGPDQVKTVMKKVSDGQYGLACTRFFEITHQIPENALSQVIAHPNQYFEESQKIIGGKKTFKQEADVHMNTSQVYASKQMSVKKEEIPPDMDDLDDDDLALAMDEAMVSS